jgi:hypothetical protein
MNQLFLVLGGLALLSTAGLLLVRSLLQDTAPVILNRYAKQGAQSVRQQPGEQSSNQEKLPSQKMLNSWKAKRTNWYNKFIHQCVMEEKYNQFKAAKYLLETARWAMCVAWVESDRRQFTWTGDTLAQAERLAGDWMECSTLGQEIKYAQTYLEVLRKNRLGF